MTRALRIPRRRDEAWRAAATREQLLAELDAVIDAAEGVREGHARHWRDLTSRAAATVLPSALHALAAAVRSAKGVTARDAAAFHELADDDLAREDALETARRIVAWLTHHGWRLTHDHVGGRR